MVDLSAFNIAKVWLWLESINPGSRQSDLEKVAMDTFGPIKWSSQMGWGEGMIICTFQNSGIVGVSDVDCQPEEALLHAVYQSISA